MADIADLEAKLQAIRNGSSEEFRAVYEGLIDQVYPYVRYRTSTEDLALDLTQEVFIDLYQALRTFTYHTRSQFYSFVFVIVKRKLAKHYAEQNLKQPAVAFDESVTAAPAQDIETADLVHRELAKLDDMTREIIILHHWSRYTFSEIAALLSLTESAVRVRHHRALKSLSAFLITPL
jgi:RNA polymerase sigma factor (sigma-70 family)